MCLERWRGIQTTQEPSPEVRELIENSSWGGILKKLQELVESDDKRAISTLKEFLLQKVRHPYMKHDVPRLVSLALLRKGPDGHHESKGRFRRGTQVIGAPIRR